MPYQNQTEINKLNDKIGNLKSLNRDLCSISNTCHKTIFENSSLPQAICEMQSNLPGQIIDCNKEFTKKLDMTKSHLMSEDFMDILEKGEKKKLFLLAFDYKNKMQIFLKFNNKTKPCRVTIEVLKHTSNQLLLITIEENKENVSSLEKAVEQTFVNTKQALFTIKHDEILSFVSISLSVFHITGFTSEQLTLNPYIFWNNCHPEDAKKIMTWLKKEEDIFYSPLIRFIHSDGQMIWLELNLAKDITSEGKNNQFFMLVHEKTNQQQKIRLSDKKDKYGNTSMLIAKRIIKQNIEDSLKYIFNLLLKNMNIERSSIYIEQNNTEQINETLFTNNIGLEQKINQPSNKRIWANYKAKFKFEPIITYQSSNEIFLLEPKHYSPFTDKEIKSILIIPIKKENKTLGFICSATLNDSTNWDRTDINFMMEIADLISISV